MANRKKELKSLIEKSEAEIESLEKKRARSQSALMHAMLNQVEPNPTDAEYFKVFSSLIDVERANLRKLKDELSKL